VTLTACLRRAASKPLALLACGFALAAGPAAAHVTLDLREAPADSTVRVAIRIPHGCDGAATTAVRLQIPPVLRNVKPAPKPGWALETVQAAEASASPAAAVTGGHGSGPVLREVAWRGGPLPDAFYDEFILVFRTPATPGETIYFPIVQECEGNRVSRWIERPQPGGGEPRLPAYGLRIVAKR
jgi:uncharacterized protein YcnI